MELKPAKRKKFSAPQNCPFIPSTPRQFFKVSFNGSSCVVKSHADMMDLFVMGFYGKGNFSKSKPVFNERNDDFPDIVYQQQWENRQRLPEYENDRSPAENDPSTDLARRSLEQFLNNPVVHAWPKEAAEKRETQPLNTTVPNWTLPDNENTHRSELHEMVDEALLTGRLREQARASTCNQMVVVNEGDSRFDDFIPPPQEHLQLTLEETFFLSRAVDKFAVFDENNKKMTDEDMWLRFQSASRNFIPRYTVYYWFRSRGWVVRSGLKYGGDFLLYEKGPEFCHSSYLVRILDDNAQLQWKDLSMMQRLVETFKKDILFCAVEKPDHVDDNDMKKPDVINKLNVREVICRRWIPSQQR